LASSRAKLWCQGLTLVDWSEWLDLASGKIARGQTIGAPARLHI
jgi:hypothetical protein